MPAPSSANRRRRSLWILGSSGGAILAAMLVVLPALGSGAGCATQETTLAPDAGVPPCEAGPFKFGCEPIGEDQPGCNTDDGTSTLLTRLPRSTRYPVDCVANLVGERDEGGNCKLDAVCKCLVTTITPPPVDGGDDAAPPPTPITAPAWNCSP
jgi:hypothetical protein